MFLYLLWKDAIWAGFFITMPSKQISLQFIFVKLIQVGCRDIQIITLENWVNEFGAQFLDVLIDRNSHIFVARITAKINMNRQFLNIFYIETDILNRRNADWILCGGFLNISHGKKINRVNQSVKTLFYLLYIHKII